MFDASILRISDKKMAELIDLYKAEKCLWHTKHAHYRHRSRRELAARKIAKTLNIPDFTARHVMVKFRNLRNSYSQELKKIAKAEENGMKYKPTVFWFNTIDSFLKPHLRKPIGSSSQPSSSQASDPLESHVEIVEDWVKQEQDEEEEPVVAVHSDIYASDTEIISKSNESGKRTLELEFSATERQSKKSKPTTTDQKSEDRTYSSEDIIISVIEKSAADNTKLLEGTVKTLINDQHKTIRDLSNKIESLKPSKEDVYDTFGKYVAVLMRTLPPKKALKVQPQIISLITKAGCEDSDDE